ncbi:heavy metal sensor histidine kinase [Xenophilus arseniciresistens]|uniref:Sensor protein n=1 Tax=Xenophilus arseniciresistens TaxID=1283306 RepID=A0AAE3N5C6_9BURK|nr:heavy metal sensor histidine kinase [Xenophilus arseniciresistens]MDA7414898.1 heavy metal sensor histidine kinase [Xenophilus arseniciresistens]
MSATRPPEGARTAARQREGAPVSAGSIQASLSRWLAVQTLVGLSVVCAGIYAAISWGLAAKHEDEYRQHYEMVRHAIGDGSHGTVTDDEDDVQHKLRDIFASHPDLAIELTLSDQPFFAHQPATTGPTRWVWRDAPEGELTVQGQPLKARMALDVGRDDLMRERLGYTLIVTAALGSLLVSLTGFWLVRRSLAPLKLLAAETAEVGPDRPGRRIAAGAYAAELQPWIEQFNALLQRAEGAYAQLEAFNADLAHELRTPLSNMIAQVEVELGRSRSEQALREALGSCLEEVRRMSAIMADMLFLSQADRGAKARRSAPCSLAEQVQAVAEFHEPELEAKALSLDVRGDAQLAVDTGLLRRAISNLMSNAVRHAEPGSTLVVSIEPAASGVSISVQNRGPVIAPGTLERIFERFFRADAARTGSSQHHGLGLAIVAAIARMHDGRTFASSALGLTRIGLHLAHPPSRQK